MHSDLFSTKKLRRRCVNSLKLAGAPNVWPQTCCSNKVSKLSGAPTKATAARHSGISWCQLGSRLVSDQWLTSTQWLRTPLITTEIWWVYITHTHTHTPVLLHFRITNTWVSQCQKWLLKLNLDEHWTLTKVSAVAVGPIPFRLAFQSHWNSPLFICLFVQTGWSK